MFGGFPIGAPRRAAMQALAALRSRGFERCRAALPEEVRAVVDAAVWLQPTFLAYGDSEDLPVEAEELSKDPASPLDPECWRELLAEGAAGTSEDFGLVRRRVAAASDAVFGAWVAEAQAGSRPGSSAGAASGDPIPGLAVAAVGPWKWPTRRGRRVAGASTDRERKQIEYQERSRWVKALGDLIVECGLPMAKRVERPPFFFNGVGGGVALRRSGAT